MDKHQPPITSSTGDCIELIRKKLGTHWIVGAPLGLGKPNHLINAIYQAARADSSISLEIFTALSLNPPKSARGLKQRFLGPFMKRQFGDYPRLDYLQDLDSGTVPDNISISEFYFRSGSRLHDLHAQRHYVSSNYTHVARDMESKGVNVLVQLLGVDPACPDHYSLGSNPDVSLDLLSRIDREKILVIGQLNEEMPYMDGDAEISASEFDLILENHPQRLFAVPRMPVSDQDFLIGLHASRLIRDGGTLQLGIGSLGDAVSYFTVLRHTDNPAYLKLLGDVDLQLESDGKLNQQWGGNQPFEVGLYAASEMFMEGFLHLFQAGVLKRRVYDDIKLQNLLNQGAIKESLTPDTLDVLYREGVLPKRLDKESLAWLLRFGVLDSAVSCDEHFINTEVAGATENDLSKPEVRRFLASHALGKNLNNAAVLHAAFFLGSQWMYDTLNTMSKADRSLFRMTGVSRINQLYGGEELDRVQRLDGRFINTTMKMTLLGAAVSDQLEDGQVVSGVGGQYNFVAMAHTLERGRSILMLRSYRGTGAKAESNVVWEYPHHTIPRHLRDIVVTEYGAVDLRSANDEDVIKNLICIADSRWQEQLRNSCVKAGKLEAKWSIPEMFQNNTPKKIANLAKPWRAAGLVTDYPFGSDFTEEEQRIAKALGFLASRGGTRLGRVRLLLDAWMYRSRSDTKFLPCLERMELQAPSSLRGLTEQKLLCFGLNSTEANNKRA